MHTHCFVVRDISKFNEMGMIRKDKDKKPDKLINFEIACRYLFFDFVFLFGAFSFPMFVYLSAFFWAHMRCRL
jgi:hypothetical protein